MFMNNDQKDDFKNNFSKEGDIHNMVGESEEDFEDQYPGPIN